MSGRPARARRALGTPPGLNPAAATPATGMPLRRAAALLNEVAAHALHAGLPPPGEQVELVGGPLLRFADVAEPSAHLAMAVEFYGPGVRAMQVLHADDRGHWPWQRGYRGVRGGQPVLGEVASPAIPGP